MSWWSRPDGWPWRSRAAGGNRRKVAGAAILLMVAGFLPAIGATADAPKAHAAAAPSAPEPPSVHGTQGMHYNIPHMPAATSAPLGPVSWPAAHSAVASVAGALPARTSARALASLTTGRVAVPGTPVFVRPASASRQGPTSVAVTVGAHSLATRLRITGVVFSVAARRGSGPLTVGLDYGSFADAYGGNFGERLRLVELPACALTTPQLGRCAAQRPVRGAVNWAGLRSATATVTLPATRQAVVLAATTTTYTTGNSDGGDGGGAAGSYTATTLKPSGSWTAGGSTGDFTYSYPITVPPAPSDMAPDISLSYDSGEVDGQTAATQAQANWLGDGWSTPQNFIEQSYVPCADSPEGTKAAEATNDECYDGQVLSLSLNGLSTSIVADASSGTTKYVLQDDNGDVVTKVTGSGNGTGTNDTSYWVITDPSGTSYYFGRNELPGWKSGDATTTSVDYEPVYAAHSGDPCYSTTWSKSVCTMAYRWNLDYVTDVHGNAMAWYYDQAPNAYLEDAAPTYTSMPNASATYIRDSYLDHIDYGFTDGNAYAVNSGHAPDQVRFATGSRCNPTASSCPAISSSNSGTASADYPDVPYDLACTLGKACLVSDPTFWSTVSLAGITTWQWTGSAYAQVDGWTFTQAMPATGDGTSPTLFLASISREGFDTTAGGSAVSVPAVIFGDPATGRLDNRVNPTDTLPAITRQRITTITTETGSQITVSYELASSCTSTDQSSPAANTGSCFPVWWTPAGLSMQKDWFNKYQVASVTQTDPTGGNAELYTGYKYIGGAAWHYDDNELVKQAYRTYGQYRGFGDVQTFTGQGNDPQTETETTYYRGMSQDNTSATSNAPAVPLADSQGGSHDDTDQLAGDPLEDTDYNYSGGPVTGSTIYSYWVSAAAATRDRTAVGLPPLTATAAGQVEEWARTALHSSSGTAWRKTETDTSYYAAPTSQYFGLPQYTYEHGDLSLTGDNQVRCTTDTYEPPSASGDLVGLLAQVEAVAEPCGGSSPAGASAPTAAETNALAAPATPSSSAQVLSDTCTIYDDPGLAQALTQAVAAGTADTTSCPTAVPTKGDISEVQAASGYSGGTFTYQPESAAVYDAVGRVTNSWDGNGNETTTAFTANSSGLTTGITTTNALGQNSSVSLDPLRGLTVGSSDLNGVTSTLHYDGLGRVIAEWGDSRAAGTTSANATFSYNVSPSAPSAVTTNILNDAGGLATSTTLYDSLLRVRQTQDPTPQGGRLVTDTFYDSRGWEWKVNDDWWDSANSPSTSLATVNGLPIPDSKVPDQTVTAYDGLGRPVLVTSYDDATVNSQQATVYGQAVDDSFTSDGDGTISVPLNARGNPYAGGAATETATDALGRTVQLLQYTTLPSVSVATTSSAPITTTVTASGGATQATDYGFDDAGHQTTVTDEATASGTPQSWTSVYNLLGQATSQDDPDSGQTSGLLYDGDGNLLQSTDALGKTLSWTYDALNRKTGEYDAAYASRAGSNQLDAWAYDNSNGAVTGMPNPNGHLTTTTSYVGGTSGSAYTEQAGGFTGLGAPISDSVTIPSAAGGLAGTYKFSHSYEAISGNPYKDLYPASPGGGALPAETVTHGYGTANGLDLPIALAGLDSYGANVTYTAFGQVGGEEIGSTTTNADITNSYDPHTGQLTDTNLTNPAVSNTPIDDTSYTYDAAGNPTSQTETRQGTTSETQCFAYDTLDRLTEAWTATDNCAANPDAAKSGATVGDGISGAAYWTSWTYTPLGQRNTETDHGLSGAADSVTQYIYNGNGKNQPDTLTSTQTTTGSSATVTGSSALQFDTDGNVTGRTVTTGGTSTTEQLTWNDDGTLGSVINDPNTSSAATSSYVYDADGNLLLQTDPATSTAPATTILYLPGEELSLNTSTGAVTGTRFYALPGGGEVVRTGADPTSGGAPGYYFQLTDLHGTATLAIGPSLTAASATWREYTPYGNPRGPTVTWVDNLGFLNKPDDAATGLTDIGARWYDPVTATFQSIDPVFEATSPQQHNGYTYGAGNPITNSDPSGLCIEGVNCITGGPPPPPPSNSSSQSGGNNTTTGDDTSTGNNSYYTKRHNAAVAMVKLYLRIKFGGPGVQIDTNYRIDNARWYGKNYGEADVVLIRGNEADGYTAYIWEIKHVGPSELNGVDQLAEYIRALGVDHPGWKVLPGWNIPQLVGADPMGEADELVAESTTTRYFANAAKRPGGDLRGIVGWWTRNNRDPQRQNGSIAVYPAGSHVVGKEMQDDAGHEVKEEWSSWGDDTESTDPASSIDSADTPQNAPQVPQPATQQDPCYSGRVRQQGLGAHGSGVTLDAKVARTAPSGCGGSGGLSGQGDDEGDGDGGDFFGDVFGFL